MKSGMIKNLIFLAFTLTVFMGILEVLARLILDKPQAIHIKNLDQQAANPKRKHFKAISNPDGVLYEKKNGRLRLKKNVNISIQNHLVSHRDIEISTNSLGYRYTELKEKTKDHFRVLVLGDSITLGDYVSFEETYPAAIQQHLKSKQAEVARLLHKKIQVINAGVGAIGLANEFSILMETGLTTKPDVVLIGLYLNDTRNSITLDITKKPYLLGRSYLLSYLFDRFQILSRSYLFDEIQFESSKEEEEKEAHYFLAKNPVSDGNWKTDWAAFNKLVHFSYYDWGFAWSQTFWRKIKTIMELLKDAAWDNGFKLKVVLLPSYYQVVTELNRNEPQQFFKRLMTELNIDHLDILPALREKYQTDGKIVYFDQCHMTPEGNSFVGKLVGEFLIQEIKTFS